MTEAGKEGLPDWLHFDPATNSLQGVPSPDDLGHQLYIEVTAEGQVTKDTLSRAKDIFAIKVVEDNVHSESNAVPLKDVNPDRLQPIKCQQGSSVTMATVVIDADVGGLSPQERLGIMDGMCSHLNMPVGVVRLLPMGNKPMFDSSALVAGPGDVKEPQHAGVVMEWEVGCGNVHAAHMPILTKLESTSSDGTMSKAIGHGVIGWHVTNNKPQAPKRMKRQLFIHPTPTQGMSGGLPTGRPVSTVTVTDKDVPTTRDVPTMASPTFTEIQPSHTHSKHKHRTKTKGRHHKTKQPKHSPTRVRTSVPKTVLPTASMTHIMPTRVLEVTATMEASVSHIPPVYTPSSPGVSRTLDIIEPSIVPTQAPSASSPTQILPTRSYQVPIVTSSGPIQPTETGPVVPSTEDQRPVVTTSTTVTPTPPVIPTEKFNFPPIVKNFLRPMRITEGDILELPIPVDTFNDYEDGDTTNLKLVLMTIDGLTIPPISWIRLDDVTQTLYGLPREQHIGVHEYLLAAIDKYGKIARLVFEMVVERRSREHKISHEFSVTLNMDYKLFIMAVDQQINVASKLANLYGDPYTHMITVTRLEEGSVRYAWTNNSLSTDHCPIREVSELLSYLITIDDTLNPKLIEAMRPIEVLKAGVQPGGVCEAYPIDAEVSSDSQPKEDKPPKNEEGEEGEGDDEEGEDVESEPRETSDEDVLITTVIPAVVIAAMLLLAGLIACILYRKKRKGKLSDEDQHTFINKGIPIIFSDELDERPDQPTKPLILEDEKPPLPPPDYPRSASGSQLSTPRSDHKEPLIDMVTTDEEGDMSPYHPPPPVTGSLGQRGTRSRNQQPAYRNPPPYVPP